MKQMTNKKSVFIDIDEEFLAKHKEQLKEAAIDHYGTGTDGKTQLIYAISEEQADTVDTRIEEIDADNNTITVSWSIDHKLPKNRGGSNELINLHLVCIKCNKVKGDLTDEEFKQLMAFVKEKPIIYENLYKRLRMAGMVFMFSRKKAN